jgi:IclR family transcriptional regulator, acetate operon repressor
MWKPPSESPHNIVAMSAPRRDRVQSLDRALDVLEALAAGGELGVSEVAARTGLVVSTAHRLLTTLADRGYVQQTAAQGRYALGLKVVELAGSMQARTAALCAAARPHLERLRHQTGETANLVILEADRVVYVDQVPGRHSVRMFTELGSSARAHTTASGKGMLAYRPTDAVARLYPPEREPLERLTPRTLTTLDALLEDFERIRRRGYALDNEEHEEGVSCVAAPVFDASGTAFAAISISAPTTRIVHADTGELGQILHRHAADISAALGYNSAAA